MLSDTDFVSAIVCCISSEGDKEMRGPFDIKKVAMLTMHKAFIKSEVNLSGDMNL